VNIRKHKATPNGSGVRRVKAARALTTPSDTPIPGGPWPHTSQPLERQLRRLDAEAGLQPAAARNESDSDRTTVWCSEAALNPPCLAVYGNSFAHPHPLLTRWDGRMPVLFGSSDHLQEQAYMHICTTLNAPSAVQLWGRGNTHLVRDGWKPPQTLFERGRF
jgi:hypothetical protein